MQRFNQLPKVLLLVLAVLARPSAQAATPVAATSPIARGPLRVHPTNPRSFTDDGHRAVYLRVEWIHPVEDKVFPPEAVTAGAQRTLKAPFLGEAVVHLTASPAKGGASMTFPGRDWDEATPESQGVNGTKLKEAVAWLDSHSYSARGAAANACFVVPEWNLVIARLAAAPEDSKASEHTWNTFFGKLGLVASEPEPEKRRREHGSSPSKLHL